MEAFPSPPLSHVFMLHVLLIRPHSATEQWEEYISQGYRIRTETESKKYVLTLNQCCQAWSHPDTHWRTQCKSSLRVCAREKHFVDNKLAIFTCAGSNHAERNDLDKKKNQNVKKEIIQEYCWQQCVMETQWETWMVSVHKSMPQGFHRTSLCWRELEGTTVKLIWQARKTAFFSRSSSKGRRPVPPSVSLTAPVPLWYTHTHTHTSAPLTDNSLVLVSHHVSELPAPLHLCTEGVCVGVCVCESKVFVRRFCDLAYLLKGICHNIWNRGAKVLDTCNHPRQWRSSSDPAKASLPKAQGMMRVRAWVCVRARVRAPSALIMNAAWQSKFSSPSATLHTHTPSKFCTKPPRLFFSYFFFVSLSDVGVVQTSVSLQ